MASAATMLAMAAFLISLISAYYAIVLAREMDRWRAMRDHPANRNRRPIGPEDSDDWDPL